MYAAEKLPAKNLAALLEFSTHLKCTMDGVGHDSIGDAHKIYIVDATKKYPPKNRIRRRFQTIPYRWFRRTGCIINNRNNYERTSKNLIDALAYVSQTTNG